MYIDFLCCILVFYESKEPDPDVIEFLNIYVYALYSYFY